IACVHALGLGAPLTINTHGSSVLIPSNLAHIRSNSVSNLISIDPSGPGSSTSIRSALQLIFTIPGDPKTSPFLIFPTRQTESPPGASLFLYFVMEPSELLVQFVSETEAISPSPETTVSAASVSAAPLVI